MNCDRCGEPDADGYDDVEEDGGGVERDVIVHWGCMSLTRQRQTMHDFFEGGVYDPGEASEPDNQLWNVLWPDEREIVLAMLNNRDSRRALMESFAPEGRQQQDEQLRQKALRVVGLGDS